MRTRPLPLLTAALALAGCAGPGAAPPPASYAVEGSNRLVALDAAARDAAGCSGLMARSLADGRLQLLVNLKDRQASPAPIEVQCEFENDRGAPIGDDSPWEAVTLTPGVVQTLLFTSRDTRARTYRIRVRSAG
jgi:hypothetical protein